MENLILALMMLAEEKKNTAPPPTPASPPTTEECDYETWYIIPPNQFNNPPVDIELLIEDSFDSKID